MTRPNLRVLTHATTDTPETLDWEQFQARFRFEQGQHCTLLGPTGFGKSTMATYLQARRQYVVIFATKARDEVIDNYREWGYRVQRRWQPEGHDRIILQPPLDPDNVYKQAQEFSYAMTSIFRQGGWCVVWDEAVYLSEFLKLDHKMSLLWQQGRALGISIIAATQRPAHLPLYAYDAPTHIFFWRMRLDRDVDRVAQLGGLDIGAMRATIRNLPKFHALYYNKETEETYIINAPEVLHGSHNR